MGVTVALGVLAHIYKENHNLAKMLGKDVLDSAASEAMKEATQEVLTGVAERATALVCSIQCSNQ